MVVTAKQLRLQTSKILKTVQRAGSVTVTLRGKPVAKISSLVEKKPAKDLTGVSVRSGCGLTEKI